MYVLSPCNGIMISIHLFLPSQQLHHPCLIDILSHLCYAVNISFFEGYISYRCDGTFSAFYTQQVNEISIISYSRVGVHFVLWYPGLLGMRERFQDLEFPERQCSGSS